MVSLPNACHDIIIAEMVHNQFNYRDCGLQDKTHIRWFGHDNLKDFFFSAGYSIVEEDFIIKDRSTIERYEEYKTNELENLLKSRVGGNVYQFVERLVHNNYAQNKRIRTKSNFKKLQVKKRTG